MEKNFTDDLIPFLSPDKYTSQENPSNTVLLFLRKTSCIGCVKASFFTKERNESHKKDCFRFNNYFDVLQITPKI